MTQEPKSVGKMADFEILTICISLHSDQMCIYFSKDLVTWYCLYLVKNSILDRLSFANWYNNPQLVAKVLTLR